MARIPPTVTQKPDTYTWDPELSLRENAVAAYQWNVGIVKINRIAEARKLAATVLHLDDIEVEFREDIAEGTLPQFVADGELIQLGFSQQGAPTLHLVDLCGDCGSNPSFYPFQSLEEFGRELVKSEEREAYVCGQCAQKHAVKAAA